MEFWEYLDKVGMMHTGKGMREPLNVEFVHIGATLGFLQDVLVEAVLSHHRLKLERKIAVVRALGKVLWIQNDLFAKWYVRDGEEFASQKREPKVEKEGFLNGTMVVSPEEQHDSGEECFSPSEVGSPTEELAQCPFSGILDKVGGMHIGQANVPAGHPHVSS
jgi:hypothetical protein